LPAWVREQAARLGLALDSEASKALVAQVGDRQQRLLRELEKLAREADAPRASGEHDGARDAPNGRTAAGAPALAIDAEDIERRAARSSQWRAYELADALVAGDVARATA